MENQDGNAPDKGAQIQGKGENSNLDTEQGENAHREKEPPKSVPYARFQEVVAQRNSVEEAISGIAELISAEIVPENLRGLIPDLQAADKIKWIFEAKKQGLFNSGNANSGPDSKRPISKPSANLSSLSPVAMIAQGFK